MNEEMNVWKFFFFFWFDLFAMVWLVCFWDWWCFVLLFFVLQFVWRWSVILCFFWTFHVRLSCWSPGGEGKDMLQVCNIFGIVVIDIWVWRFICSVFGLELDFFSCGSFWSRFFVGFFHLFVDFFFLFVFQDRRSKCLVSISNQVRKWKVWLVLWVVVWRNWRGKLIGFRCWVGSLMNGGWWEWIHIGSSCVFCALMWSIWKCIWSVEIFSFWKRILKIFCMIWSFYEAIRDCFRISFESYLFVKVIFMMFKVLMFFCSLYWLT